MNSTIMKVSRARTALKLGLEALGAKPGQSILLPDYCCDVILHPLAELGLEVISYEVFDDLSPDWDKLNNIDAKNVFGIIMVHYFGQPQNIKKFQDYSQAKGVYLIEDNAHGYGGSYKGKCLGTFGEIGISSPRKILNIPLGGILYLQNKPEEIDLNLSLKAEPLHFQLLNFIKCVVYLCRPVYKYLAYRKRRNYDYSDPYAFKEMVQSNTKISSYEKFIIQTAKIENIAKYRRKLWREWSSDLTEQGLWPVFTDLSENSCPWAIAFYCDDLNQRNSWINWGLVKKLPLFCWPRLPDAQIQKKGSAFEKWEKIVCVALNDPPPTSKIERKVRQ